MSIYTDIAVLAAIVTYIVDASGFTQSWRGWIARKLHTTEDRLRPLRPFDCSTCATWWSCLALVVIRGELSMLTVGACALASMLAYPAGILLDNVRTLLADLFTKIQL
jgi:hypothetical protein